MGRNTLQNCNFYSGEGEIRRRWRDKCVHSEVLVRIRPNRALKAHYFVQVWVTERASVDEAKNTKNSNVSILEGFVRNKGGKFIAKDIKTTKIF